MDSILQYETIPDYRAPDDINVATITLLFELPYQVVFQEIYENIIFMPNNSNGITKVIQYKRIFDNNDNPNNNGKVYEKKIKTSDSEIIKQVKTCFPNQITYYYQYQPLNSTLSKTIICFLFNSGTIKCTGLTVIDDIEDFIRQNINVFNNIKRKLTNETILCPIITTFETIHYKIVNYNVQSKFPFSIKLEYLFNIIRSSPYSLIQSDYQPDIYAGLRIKYYYNDTYIHDLINTEKEGKCQCITQCIKKKKTKIKSNDDDKCKICTITIFRTGNILIHGCISMKQVNTLYLFICKVLIKHYHEIYLRQPIIT